MHVQAGALMFGSFEHEDFSPYVHLSEHTRRLDMDQRTTQRLGLGIGIGLIAVYSVIMITTDGSAPLAWVLLILGIAALIATGVSTSRQRDD